MRNLQAGVGGDVISGGAGRDRLAGGAGQDRLASQPPKNAAARPAPIDPSKTPVFRTGPDGKLHPIPGWHTTGPFDFGTWAGNIDWGGVGHDLGDIAAGVTGWFLPPVLGKFEKAAVLGNFWNVGDDTANDLKEADRKSGR